MDANFATCLQIILQDEGGFVDDPADPGGATKYGITLAELSAWRGSTQTIADVESLQISDVGPIYKADYWGVAHCSEWPSGLDLCVFDAAVNEGVGRSVRQLQTAVGVSADGEVGLHTIAAVATCDVPETIRKLEAIRDAFYEGLKTFPRFGKGWLARDGRTLAEALKMATP